MKKIISIFILLLSLSSMAQFNHYEEPTRVDPEEVLDEKFGIEAYERLNKFYGNQDTIRYCKDIPCLGYVRDFYLDGTLLHKGYYDNGHLKVYKNYYPDGTLEREFKVLSDNKTKLFKYHSNGNLKSEITYINGVSKEWMDYWENGKLSYRELYNNSIEYYTLQESYYEDGVMESILTLEKKSKMLYDNKFYHPNGQLKEFGAVVYHEDLFDYLREGKWEYFKEDGTPEKVVWYVHGKPNKTNEF